MFVSSSLDILGPSVSQAKPFSNLQHTLRSGPRPGHMSPVTLGQPSQTGRADGPVQEYGFAVEICHQRHLVGRLSEFV